MLPNSQVHSNEKCAVPVPIKVQITYIGVNSLVIHIGWTVFPYFAGYKNMDY